MDLPLISSPFPRSYTIIHISCFNSTICSYHHHMSPPCICIIYSQHQHHERRPAGGPLIVWPDSNKVCTVGRELSTGTIRLRKVYTHFQTNKIGQTWKTMSKLGHTYCCTWTGVSWCRKLQLMLIRQAGSKTRIKYACVEMQCK